jgi:phospholipid N-methyltransferase
MPNVTIHEMSILDFISTEKFDATVSGLPLNAFSSQFVEQVLHKYKEVTKEGGFVSYFEYMGLEKIKQCFLCGDHYTDFNRVLSLKERFVTDYGTETDNIWLNMTPARVRHCQMPVQATA